MTDVIVVGAGIVGAACAYHLRRSGASVTVLDAGPIAGGASSAGEGNLLVSDRLPGPELALALWSRQLWEEFADEAGAGAIEFERKGGLIVAGSVAGYEQVAELLAGQREAGVEVTEVAAGALAGYEPNLARDLAGGAYYPQDAQVQPMLATAQLLRGVQVRTETPVRAVETDGKGRVTGVRLGGSIGRERAQRSGARGQAAGTWRNVVRAGAVVNAAGVAGAELAATVGTRLPIAPRRGFILVTEPVANARENPPVRHKVYAAEYLGGVVSDDAGLHSSAVVESTRAGTILIGSSRERVGFDAAYPLPVLRRIAAQAVTLFPFLAQVRVLRAYRGFRPFVADHLPVIGPDPHVTGLWHACGHEGAGIGLAPATGAMIAAMVTGVTDPPVDPAPFSPTRFT